MEDEIENPHTLTHGACVVDNPDDVEAGSHCVFASRQPGAAGPLAMTTATFGLALKLSGTTVVQLWDLHEVVRLPPAPVPTLVVPKSAPHPAAAMRDSGNLACWNAACMATFEDNPSLLDMLPEVPAELVKKPVVEAPKRRFVMLGLSPDPPPANKKVGGPSRAPESPRAQAAVGWAGAAERVEELRDKVRTGLADSDSFVAEVTGVLVKLAKSALGTGAVNAEHEKEIEGSVRSAVKNLRTTLLNACHEGDPRCSSIVKASFCQALEAAVRVALKNQGDEVHGLAKELEKVVPKTTGIDTALPLVEEELRSRFKELGARLASNRRQDEYVRSSTEVVKAMKSAATGQPAPRGSETQRAARPPPQQQQQRPGPPQARELTPLEVALSTLPPNECRDFHRLGICPHEAKKGKCIKEHNMKPPLCQRPGLHK